jgi:hypothetical protein
MDAEMREVIMGIRVFVARLNWLDDFVTQSSGIGSGGDNI